MAAVRIVAWGAGFSVVGTTLKILWSRWRRSRSRKKYDGLDGVVSFSSRLIAAARAIESMRADALFVDPFAKLLAGPKAMARHQKFDEADKSVNINKGAASSPAPPTPAAQPQQLDPSPSDHQQSSSSQPDVTQQQTQQQVQQQEQQQQGRELALHEGREVSRLVLRTVFFDEATLMAAGRPAPRSDKALAAVSAHIQQQALPPCTQVAMLGAGMDTRPWRLPLPPHLKWFELDRSDVLAAKRAALRDAGASFEPTNAAQAPQNTTVSAQDSSSSGNSSSNSSGGSKGGGKQEKQGASGSSVKYPLRVASWSCADADLQKPGWVNKLQEAGLDLQAPTVWAAEGLLYYLEPDSVAPMLKEAARMSPAGSFIIANFMTDEGLKLLNVNPLTAKPGDVKPPPSSNISAPNSSSQSPHPNSSSTSSTAPTTTEPAASAANVSSATVAAGGGKQGSSAAADASTAAGPSETKKLPADDGIKQIGLLSQFKWGCPDNVEEFFEACGWKLLVRYSLSQATDAYGWKVLHTAASRVRTDSQEVQFVVGVVMK